MNLQTPETISVSTPPIPTMEAPGGIRFDFNCGLRVQFPEEGGPWTLVAMDEATGTVLIDKDISGPAQVATQKKYFLPIRFSIYDYSTDTVFRHRLDLSGKKVLILIMVTTLGDTLAWMPQAEAFRQKHGCELYLIVSPALRSILEKQYPDIRFLNVGEEAGIDFYATFMLGLWWSDDRTDFQPVDHRLCKLSSAASNILGLPDDEIKPRLDLSAPRQIKEKYVCIAVQSSMVSKDWTAQGWYDVVRFLLGQGYRVLCIDKDPVTSDGKYTVAAPIGAEDWTGSFSLQDRINQIKDAEFFIGCSSGLAWLAWACNVPVIMIGGFSLPLSEFYNPYRVINYHACTGCWNDISQTFQHKNWAWCPRHQGTDREHECMKMISSKHVIDAIRTAIADINEKEASQCS